MGNFRRRLARVYVILYLVCYLLVSSLQLSFGSRRGPVSICNVASCGRMPRTCESIARLKIEHKQRTKCCNLQHFALSDGKNPRKYHSLSPPKVARTLLFTGFRSRHDLRFFEKRVNTSVFAFIKAKNRFKKGRKCCNLQGFGAATGKKLRKYQRFGVQKWPKHRYLQSFVPSTFS